MYNLRFKLYDFDEERKLIRSWKINKNLEARNKLFFSCLALVKATAHKYSRDNPELFEDLVQIGILGLLKAIDKFELRYKVKLATYAHWWIRVFIQQFLNRPTEELSLDEKIKDDDLDTFKDEIQDNTGNPEHVIGINQLHDLELVYQQVDCLADKRGKTIIKLRYLQEDPLTLEEVANVFSGIENQKISKERIRQIEVRTINTLRYNIAEIEDELGI